MEQGIFNTVVQENVNRQPETQGRIFPLAKLLVTATTSASPNTFTTVKTGRALLVKRLVASNITSSADTISIDAVPDGGSLSTATAELRDYAIAGNMAVDLTDLIGGFYAPGTTLRVWAGTTDRIMLSGYGEDVF